MRSTSPIGYSLFLLTAFLAWPPPVVLAAGEVEIRYLANAGFLIAAGDTKVLVDALYGDGIAGYPVVPPSLRRRVEAGEQELAGVDLVLASHRHGDHFDAHAVARHLGANQDARFVSSEEAVASLAAVDPGLADRATGLWPPEGERASVEHAGIRVTALLLHHGDAPAQNLGLLVEISGLKVAHLGDTEVTAEDLRSLGLADEGIDVALVPYWYFISSRLRSGIGELGALQVVAMHLPAPDAPPAYLAPAKSFDALVEAVRAADPEAWIPLRPLEERRFRARS
jgi:L-ascorbate metabolism protein UlaG (beta-lactamase superfamily)